MTQHHISPRKIASVAALLSVYLLLFGLTDLFLQRPFARTAFAQESVGSYTVAAGDTLGTIADRFGVSVDDLVMLNQIADRNLINVGQVLLIPGTNGALAAVETASVRARPGDTLADVATRYSLDLPMLVALNHLSETHRLFPEQSILLPANQQPETPLRFGVVQHVDMPAQLIQGRTGRLWVESSQPLSLTATWNGLPLAFTTLTRTLSLSGTQTANLHEFALIPVPALIEPKPYELVISYPARNGVMLRRTWSIDVLVGDYASQNIVLPPEKNDLLAPERVETEREKVNAVWAISSPLLRWQGLFARPIDEQYQTTSPFGTRRSYSGGPFADFHAGQDFGAPAGVPVTAPATGIVALAEPLEVRGNAVIIDHGRGILTGYWHLSEIKVAAGQKITQGDVLGLVGTTGLSTGAHLHWEMRVYGVAVDPMQFLAEAIVQEP